MNTKNKIYPKVVAGGKAVPLGKNFYYMTGRKHKDGGIAIGKDPKTGLEVEDGEVMHLTKDEVKVFSSVPFLNGKSPAERVIQGDTPTKVFNAQESFKDDNNINDDGTKKALGGEEPIDGIKSSVVDNTKVNKTPIQSIKGGKLKPLSRDKIVKLSGNTNVNYTPQDLYNLDLKDNDLQESYRDRYSKNTKKLIIKDSNNIRNNQQVNTAIVDDIVKASVKNNIDPYLALSIAQRESGIGHYSATGLQNKGRVERENSPDLIFSNWEKQNRGLNKEELDGIYSGVTPRVYNKSKKYYNSISEYPFQGEMKTIKDKTKNGTFVRGYNYGDPDYPNKVNKERNILLSDQNKNVRRYVDSVANVAKSSVMKKEFGGKMSRNKYVGGGKKKVNSTLPPMISTNQLGVYDDSNFANIQTQAEQSMNAVSTDAPTNVTPPSKFSQLMGNIKVGAQQAGEAVDNFYSNRPGALNDTIGVGANIIGGLVANNANNKMLDKLKYSNAPIGRQAAKLKTTININPQLDKMRESLSAYENDINDNTASSRVALARKQRGRLASILQTNELYGNKENLETDLINKDSLNQQAVNDANTGDYNRWSEGKAAFKNAVNEKRAENTIGLVETLNAGVQDVITRGEKRNATRENMLAMAASHPNVNPRILKDLGVNSITDKMVADWDAANVKKNKKSNSKGK